MLSQTREQHRAVTILDDLIRIQSINPYFGDGARGEKEVAEYIEQRFRNMGLIVTRQYVFPDRYNLIIELRVGKHDSTLLFEAHMDTVSIGSMVNPLIPSYRDGRVYGRGACDTKGSLAGMIYALEECARNPELLSSDIVLCASVDEEHRYRGLLAFLEMNMPIAGAVVGEPTELGIVVAHKGCTRFAIQTHGKAAHSSVPDKGNNAVYQMMQIIRYIHEQLEPQLKAARHPLCGSPTIVVGTIQGGKQINIVPEWCEIEVDRRIIPGELPDQVLQDFEQNLRTFLNGQDVDFTVKELLLDWALNTVQDAHVVKIAQQAARNMGLNDELIGVPYGSDASKLQQLKGIATIVYGPGSIAQAHSKEEWVSLDEVAQAADYYLHLAQLFNKAY